MSSDTSAPKSAFKVGGEVIEVREGERWWPIRVKFDRANIHNAGDATCPVAEDEIKLVKVLDSELITLDPSDPFEQVLIKMVETNRRKRADYAVDGSPWSNFDDVSTGMGIEGFGAVESAEHNVRQKLARLTSLRQNGRTKETANEAVADTYLDLAVYAVIALAIRTHPSGKVNVDG